MMHFLKHLAAAAWYDRIALFWPFWLGVSATAMIAVPWLVGCATPSTHSPDGVKPRPRRIGLSGIAVLALLALLLAAYVALSFAWEDFTWYDDSQFTLFSLTGRDLQPFIGRENGRFFPLGLQEFNLLGRIVPSILGYHAFRVAELAIFVGILLILDDELSIVTRACIALVALISPSILISFTDLIYSEANVLLCLGGLALCVQRFERTHARGWAAIAVLCAQTMIYSKETAFVLFVGFVAARLVLRCWRVERPGWNWSRLWTQDGRFDLGLAGLALCYGAYYAVVMFPHPSLSYADQMSQPALAVALTFVKLDLLAWVFAIVAIGRFYLILRRRTTPLLLWDGLAFGAALSFLAYLWLGLTSGYYLAPVDLVAALYVGRTSILHPHKRSSLIQTTTIVVLLAIILQDVSLSAFRSYERKNVIHAKAEIARLVEARYNASDGMRGLFFPFADSYRIMEFAAYLSYRGIPVEDGRAPQAPLRLAGRMIVRDGLCVGYRAIQCHSGEAPNPGDLIVVLPDDNATAADVATYQKIGALLFAYGPTPRIGQLLRPLIDPLHIVSPEFEHRDLPDRWLEAMVIGAPK